MRLSLTGFVVDSGPFMHWFSPYRFRQIDFQDDCIDAGFHLPETLDMYVSMTWPPETKPPRMVRIEKVTKADVKIIKLQDGKRLEGKRAFRPKAREFLSRSWLPGKSSNKGKPMMRDGRDRSSLSLMPASSRESGSEPQRRNSFHLP